MTTDTSFPITGQPSPLLSQTLMSTVLPRTCHLSRRCNTALSEISNPSIYFPGPPWGYELASPGVTGSSPYPTLHKDSSMVPDDPDWIHLNSLQYNVSSYGSYERTLDFTTRYGWKPTHGKPGLEKADCGQCQAVPTSPYYNLELPCRYLPVPPAGTQALQTVITTTVAYQAYQHPALKHSDSVQEVSSLASLTYASENLPMPVYPQALDSQEGVIQAASPSGRAPVKVHGDCQAARPTLAFPQETDPSRTDGADAWDVCLFGVGSGMDYLDRAGQPFSFDNEDF